MGTKTQYECDRCGNKALMKKTITLPIVWKYVKMQKYENGNYFDEYCWLLCPSCVKAVKDAIQREI